MQKRYSVVIIGSGFSGLAAAIKLQENNIQDYVILERNKELGGTWWKNSYPGAAVDVVSRLYSFSFENFDWSRKFAKQEEILAYTNQLIDKYSIRKKAQTNIVIEKLVYDEKDHFWTIYFENGETIQSTFVINATGGLSQEHIPKIKGLDSFKGAYFHTANWNHDIDYSNKNLAVIGTGASAVQVVPEIAKKAKNVYVLQRTPHWLIPRPDKKLSNFQRKLFKIKWINKFFRGLAFIQHESRALFFVKFPFVSKIVKYEALHHLKKQVKDEDLRKKLIPNFEFGCKRVLINSDYYPALQRDNVHLETSPIQEITQDGIQLKDKSLENIDIIVFATGFHAAEKNIPFNVVGKNNISIHEQWKDYAYAYYGLACHNFPNLFMMMGPNTGTGHTSVIYFIESQLNYVIDALNKARKKKWKSIEIKKEVEDAYTKDIHKRLESTIWIKGGCNSWYISSNNINTTMYPNFSFVYRRNTKYFREDLHHIER